MQRLEVSCAVRHIYTSLGAKGYGTFQYLSFHLKSPKIHFPSELQTILISVNRTAIDRHNNNNNEVLWKNTEDRDRQTAHAGSAKYLMRQIIQYRRAQYLQKNNTTKGMIEWVHNCTTTSVRKWECNWIQNTGTNMCQNQ